MARGRYKQNRHQNLFTVCGPPRSFFAFFLWNQLFSKGLTGLKIWMCWNAIVCYQTTHYTPHTTHHTLHVRSSKPATVVRVINQNKILIINIWTRLRVHPFRFSQENEKRISLGVGWGGVGWGGGERLQRRLYLDISGRIALIAIFSQNIIYKTWLRKNLIKKPLFLYQIFIEICTLRFSKYKFNIRRSWRTLSSRRELDKHTSFITK